MYRPSSASSSGIKTASETHRLLIQSIYQTYFLSSKRLKIASPTAFGKPNSVRKHNNSMFDVLSWDEVDINASWNSKKKSNPDVIESNNEWSHKIKRSKSNWVSETMDQFRRINISPDNKEHAYIDATEDPEFRLQVPLPGSKLEKERLLEEQKKQPKKKITKPKEKKEEEADPKKNARASSAPVVGKEDDAFSSNKITEKKQAASRYLDYTKKKQKVVVNDDPDYLEAHNNRIKQRIKAFREQSRWLPNSAFQTYFGRPPFENYGRANTTPIHGGPVYGQYLKTHNINPYRGGNSPQYKQVYDRAELQSAMFPPPDEVQLPRKRPEDLRLSDQQILEFNSRNQLMPEKFTENLKKNLPKANLKKAVLFASEENTPVSTPKTQKTAQDILGNLVKLDQEIKKQKQSSLKASINMGEITPYDSFSHPLEAKTSATIKTAFAKSSHAEERSTEYTNKKSPADTRNIPSQTKSHVTRALNFDDESGVKPK